MLLTSDRILIAHQSFKDIELINQGLIFLRIKFNHKLLTHITITTTGFTKINFVGLPHQARNETKFGLDIAEEQYITKSIRENQAQGICSLLDHGLGDPVLNLLREPVSKLKLKTHILANSRKLNKYLLLDIKSLLAHLGIAETSIEDCDFVFLINDLDLLSVIPEVNTDKPIATVDLSQESTPNYSYMLLRDDGFEQVVGYAKKCKYETAVAAMCRALCCAAMSFVREAQFAEQIAINYMDDYFIPLSKAVGKDLSDFQTSIDLMTEKLEKKDA